MWKETEFIEWSFNYYHNCLVSPLRQTEGDSGWHLIEMALWSIWCLYRRLPLPTRGDDSGDGGTTECQKVRKHSETVCDRLLCVSRTVRVENWKLTLFELTFLLYINLKNYIFKHSHRHTHTYTAVLSFSRTYHLIHTVFSSHANTSETFYICNCKTATLTIKLLKSMKIRSGLLWSYYSHMGFHCVLYHVIFFIITGWLKTWDGSVSLLGFFLPNVICNIVWRQWAALLGIVCNSTTVTGHVFAINRSMSKWNSGGPRIDLCGIR